MGGLGLSCLLRLECRGPESMNDVNDVSGED